MSLNFLSYHATKKKTTKKQTPKPDSVTKTGHITRMTIFLSETIAKQHCVIKTRSSSDLEKTNNTKTNAQ